MYHITTLLHYIGNLIHITGIDVSYVHGTLLAVYSAKTIPIIYSHRMIIYRTTYESV